MTTQDNSFPIIRAGHDHWPGFLTKKNPTEEPGYDILWKVFPHTLSKDSMTHSLLLILFLFTIVVAIALKQNKWLIKLTELVPESGCLMIMGLVIALIAIKIDHIKDPLPLPLLWLDDWFIEHLLIAPIILHASYGLYHPHFFGQLGTILLLALLATVLNAIIIAVILFFLVPYIMDHDLMNFYHTITYGALISAVDPVAVLAVFDSLNANKALYYLVFGESLLNDGVTYVMYEGFKAFTTISSKEHDNISAGQFVLLSVSFLTKPLGGLLVGFVVGLLATFVAKNASDNTAYLKPLMNLMFASFAYSLALMFSFSGILCKYHPSQHLPFVHNIFINYFPRFDRFRAVAAEVHLQEHDAQRRPQHHQPRQGHRRHHGNISLLFSRHRGENHTYVSKNIFD